MRSWRRGSIAVEGKMPRFIPVQCHKCSVLQIKPAQKLGLEWCCSMCRPKAEEVEATTGAPSDVESQVDVSPFEEAEEMGAVANTFRGVETLDCASYWEGLYYQSSKVQHHHALEWKHSVNPIQIYEDDSTKVEENRVSKRNRETMGQSPFLSSLWGRWQQKAAKKEVVELMEFVGGLGNQENIPPPRS